MRAAVIEEGKVVNLIIVSHLGFMPSLVDGEGAEIGDSWDGHIFSRPSPPPPGVDDYEAAVQSILEAKAREHGYDSIISACSYAGAPNQFQAESQAFITWRGACWAQCHVVLNAVNAGTMAQPTIPELLATLPAFPA